MQCTVTNSRGVTAVSVFTLVSCGKNYGMQLLSPLPTELQTSLSYPSVMLSVHISISGNVSEPLIQCYTVMDTIIRAELSIRLIVGRLGSLSLMKINCAVPLLDLHGSASISSTKIIQLLSPVPKLRGAWRGSALPTSVIFSLLLH